jgi:acyl-CoA thioesterase
MPQRKFTQRKLNQTQIRQRMLQSPFLQLIHARLAAVHADGITLECTLTKDLENIMGTLHGGVHATLADTAAGFAIQRELGGGRSITTVEMKVNYFRPVSGGSLLARARVLRMGSRLCVASVELINNKKSAGAGLITYMLLD